MIPGHALLQQILSLSYTNFLTVEGLIPWLRLNRGSTVHKSITTTHLLILVLMLVESKGAMLEAMTATRNRWLVGSCSLVKLIVFSEIVKSFSFNVVVLKVSRLKNSSSPLQTVPNCNAMRGYEYAVHSLDQAGMHIENQS